MVNISCLRAVTINNQAETDVLKLIRTKLNGKIEVFLQNGGVKRIKETTEYSDMDLKGITMHLEEKEYGTYSVKKQDKRFVRVIDESSIKYDQETGERITK